MMMKLGVQEVTSWQRLKIESDVYAMKYSYNMQVYVECLIETCVCYKYKVDF